MKKLILFLVLLSSSFSLFSQNEQTIMSGSKLGFSGVWVGGSNTISTFNCKYSSYNGGFWALEFGKKLLIGGLHYDIGNQLINGKDYFSMSSNDLYLGYTLNSYKVVHPIFSLAVGGGKLNVNNELVSQNVFTIHPAVGLEVNVFRFLHLDGQVGYRAVANTTYAAFKDTDFSGFYTQLNLKLGFSWKRYN